MGILSDLVGDLSTVSDEDLERMVQTGRLAREEEADGARGKAKRSGGGVKKSAANTILDLDLNLDDFD